MSSNSRSQEWSAPPEGILLRILSLVDTNTRLKAALVSSHWAKAAAAATTAITCTPRHSTAVDTLHQYLGKHGQHVTSLSFGPARSNREAGHVFLLKQLPCPNLLEFVYKGEAGQLLPNSGAPHLLQAATGLTRLSLKLDGEVPGFYPSLSLLTDLRQLRTLDISLHSDRDKDEPPVQLQGAMDGAVLAQLPHLTKLKLGGALSISTLRHISCLTALQKLTIQLDHAVTDTDAGNGSGPQEQSQPQPLLQHLTKLKLAASDLAINNHKYPWLAQLPALLCAVFSNGVLEPQVISAAPQLTKLMVTSGTEIAGGATGLLEFLSSLRSLQQLAICSLDMHDSTREVLFPSACGWLTAGNKLVDLSLSGLRVPQGGWQHAFPAGVQLGLTSLDLTGARGERVESEDLQRLVECCPRLRNLSLVQAVEPGIELQPVAQLAGLEAVNLGGFLLPADGEDAEERALQWHQAVCYLAQLPALGSVEIQLPDVLSRTEVLQLTVLTRLTWLHVNPHQKKDEVLLTKEGHDAVWYQLLLASLDDSACRDALLGQETGVLQQLQQGGKNPRSVQLA